MAKSPREKAWEWFSRYYRLKNSDDNGYITCYTCGERRFWKDDMQTGHLLDGRYNSILLNEEVVRIQCKSCNMFKSGNKEVFIPKYIDECGREKYDDMIRLKWTTVKRSKNEWKELEEFYKERAKEEKKKRGL